MMTETNGQVRKREADDSRWTQVERFLFDSCEVEITELERRVDGADSQVEGSVVESHHRGLIGWNQSAVDGEVSTRKWGRIIASQVVQKSLRDHVIRPVPGLIQMSEMGKTVDHLICISEIGYI